MAQHPGTTTAAPLTLPGILHKVPGTVSLLQSTADIVLQLQQEGLDLGYIRFAHLVSSQLGSSPDPIIVMSSNWHSARPHSHQTSSPTPLRRGE